MRPKGSDFDKECQSRSHQDTLFLFGSDPPNSSTNHWQQSLVLHCSRLIRHPKILLGCRDMIYSSINNQVYQLKQLATAQHDGDRGLRPLRGAFSADPRDHKR
jgi:hypothetical protein